MADGLKKQFGREISKIEKFQNTEYMAGYLAGLKEAESIYTGKLKEYTKVRDLAAALRSQ